MSHVTKYIKDMEHLYDSNIKCEGCGQNSCKADCGAQQCPAGIDIASLKTYEPDTMGQIPKNTRFLMFLPKTKHEFCSWIPWLFRAEDMRAYFNSECLGDMKLNFLNDSDCLCDSACYYKADGRLIKYSDGTCLRLPDLRGKTIVHPDPRNYFGHGLTAPNMCTGEARHCQSATEVGPFEAELDINMSFVLTLDKDHETEDSGDIGTSWNSDPAGTGSNVTYSTETGANNTDPQLRPIDIDAEIVNANVDGDEQQCMNNMQPSHSMNYFVYVCKPNLEHYVETGSLPNNPTCEDVIDPNFGNNGQDWYVR